MLPTTRLYQIDKFDTMQTFLSQLHFIDLSRLVIDFALIHFTIFVNF